MSYGITTLKDLHPIARKEHTCMFCDRIIKNGEKYHRMTLLNDYVYDWVECNKCEFVSRELNMYDDCDDEGLSEDVFQENINDYIHCNHKDWQLPFIETVDKVYEEIINKNK